MQILAANLTSTETGKRINMKLNRLSIKGIGGIKTLDLEFQPDMNIICGPNGIGKSTVLLASSFPFTWGSSIKVKKILMQKMVRLS